MPSAKTVGSRIGKLKPFLASCSLSTIRRGHELVGQLAAGGEEKEFTCKIHSFSQFSASWVVPKDQRRQGVILYLHGGGYTCGGEAYAKAFGIRLAMRYGVRVLCPAYRLAPEHPFPAALEDALEAYSYLRNKGYEKITLCGESAGGGLCYSLCLKIKALGLPMPCGIVAVSPWTDLTMSGISYQENQEIDPSLSREFLDFCVKSYAQNPGDPYVSPLLGDLTGLPPSLIFAGSDELLRSDSELLHKRLEGQGAKSALYVKPDRWHAYLMYGLQEDKKDFDRINRFLSAVMSRENKLQWMRLDNAAKIYPAARSQNWSNVFRLSATLQEPIDRDVMQSALDVTVRRFPSIAARLRRGTFWYYLQQLQKAPPLRQESNHPLTRMSRQEARQCALRVIVYENRVAVEFFHSLTDGTGGLIFLKTLLAEYLLQRYGVSAPAEQGVLGRLEEPSPAELEDSFLKYAGPVAASRKEDTAWHVAGTPEPDGYLNLTCFTLPVKNVLALSHSYGVSLTAFLCAVMMMALQELQQERVPFVKHRKPIKVLLPVNLRSIFPSRSLRNFALYTTPQIDPRLGEYELGEVCKIVHHWMGMDITPRQMSRKIATNVNSETSLPIKLMPLFIKNIAMKAVFLTVGERKSCLTISNLGNVKLPEEMKPYIKRMDFILGPQARAPYNCGVLSWGDTLYLNFIRNTKEPDLEMAFFRQLQKLNLPVAVQSN